MKRFMIVQCQFIFLLVFFSHNVVNGSTVVYLQLWTIWKSEKIYALEISQLVSLEFFPFFQKKLYNHATVCRFKKKLTNFLWKKKPKECAV